MRRRSRGDGRLDFWRRRWRRRCTANSRSGDFRGSASQGGSPRTGPDRSFWEVGASPKSITNTGCCSVAEMQVMSIWSDLYGLPPEFLYLRGETWLVCRCRFGLQGFSILGGKADYLEGSTGTEVISGQSPKAIPPDLNRGTDLNSLRTRMPRQAQLTPAQPAWTRLSLASALRLLNN